METLVFGEEKKRQRTLPVGHSELKRVKVEASKVDPVVMTSKSMGNPRAKGEGESTFSIAPEERIDLVDRWAVGMDAPGPEFDVVVAQLCGGNTMDGVSITTHKLASGRNSQARMPLVGSSEGLGSGIQGEQRTKILADPINPLIVGDSPQREVLPSYEFQDVSREEPSEAGAIVKDGDALKW